MQCGFFTHAVEFPGSDVRVVLIVALGFALFGLVFESEMTAARFFSVESIAHFYFGEFEEVGDSACFFE